MAANPQDTARLLALVVDAQAKLTQLESTSKLLIDELATSGGAQATPRLRELLATGERLVAAVQAAGSELTPRLPAGAAAGPNRAAVEAVWARELQPQPEAAAGTTTVVPTPVGQPAGALGELAASLRALPGCRLQLLQGRQPTELPAEATAVLLRCGRAFSAVVHLQRPGGLVPLRVGVLSAAEAAAALAAGGGGSGDGARSLWAPSQHRVFQQLSAQAAGALNHFLLLHQHQHQHQQQDGQAWQQQQQPAASPLELLLLWLATCGDLFSQRSSSGGVGGGDGGGGLLLLDSAAAAAAAGSQVLPLRRPCRLTWRQLWEAALNPHLRQAEPAGEAGP